MLQSHNRPAQHSTALSPLLPRGARSPTLSAVALPRSRRRSWVTLPTLAPVLACWPPASPRSSLLMLNLTKARQGSCRAQRAGLGRGLGGAAGSASQLCGAHSRWHRRCECWQPQAEGTKTIAPPPPLPRRCSALAPKRHAPRTWSALVDDAPRAALWGGPADCRRTPHGTPSLQHKPRRSRAAHITQTRGVIGHRHSSREPCGRPTPHARPHLLRPPAAAPSTTTPRTARPGKPCAPRSAAAWPGCEPGRSCSSSSMTPPTGRPPACAPQSTGQRPGRTDPRSPPPTRPCILPGIVASAPPGAPARLARPQQCPPPRPR